MIKSFLKLAINKILSLVGYEVTFEKKGKLPKWGTINFNPIFKENLYFVFLNEKMNSKNGIERYQDIVIDKEKIVPEVNRITQAMLECIDLKEFEELVLEHERLISSQMDLPCVKTTKFSDYWGVVKSLGAWGGDFVMATSDRSEIETKEYFRMNGYEVCLTFDELILQNFQKFGEVLNQESSELNTANQ